MKHTLLRSLAVTASLFLTVPFATATLILSGASPIAGNGNPAAEIVLIEANTALQNLVYLAKHDYGSGAGGSGGSWDVDGLYGADKFGVSLYSGDPATATVDWDLTGTGFTLEAVMVKTANSYNLYTVALDQKVADTIGQLVTAPGAKDSISHISFFGNRGTPTQQDVPEGGATVALLGLALGGLEAARRFMSKKA